MRVVLLTLLLAAGTGRAADNFEDLYFAAATYAADADQAASRGDWPTAYAKYTSAIQTLKQLHTTAPEWNPGVVDFRLRTYTDRLREIQPHVPTATNTTAATTTDIQAEELKLLATELARANNDKAAVESQRQHFAAVQAELETTRRAAAEADSLAKENKQLADQVIAIQDQIAGLKQQDTAHIASLTAEKQQIETRRQDLAAQLTRAQEQLAHAQEQLIALERRTPILDLRTFFMEAGVNLGRP